VAERLFFALWPGDDQRRALTRVQRALPPHHGRDAHPDDLHITLVFLGELDPEQRACAEAAADAVQGESFVLTLNRFGCFPRPRVLWCGADEHPPPLLDLVGALNRGLDPCHIRLDRRPYSPHATLARNAPPLRSFLLDAPIPWPVDGFVLATSREGGPPRYRVLRRWRLAL
jgi:2'-5' RNA ligase